jgi:16S rRNA (cytidine1402-2'-O)-methyltransferase
VSHSGRARLTERNSARLAVVSTPIGNIDDLSRRALQVLSSADVIFCEDTRHTGMLLSRVGVERRHLISLNAHNEAARIAMALEALGRDQDVALASDAGTPLISDPGARLVSAVIDAGFQVVAVPGPSAALAALVVSGFDASRFEFYGFLPRSGRVRSERLNGIAASTIPSVIFESPRRIATTLRDLVALTGEERRVVVARELTKLFEEVWRGQIGQALELARSVEPVGEHVLVLEGKGVAPEADGGSVRAALAALMEAGLSPADAVRAVEVLLGVPHRFAYAQRLALGGSSEEPAPTASGRSRKAKRA